MRRRPEVGRSCVPSREYREATVIHSTAEGAQAPIDLMMQPLLWAQVQAGGANPNSLAPLALRRWCAGLTLSSPQITPGWHGPWAFLAALGMLFLVALMVQGPIAAFRRLFDLPGHIRLVRDATRRVRKASRLVAAAIAFSVISWTGTQAMVYNVNSGRADLLLLTKSRGLGELAVEQGILAGLTPLRDLAGLGDNLPLLVFAVYLVFRASSGMMPFPGSAPAARSSGTRRRG